jgi:plastocyanin
VVAARRRYLDKGENSMFRARSSAILVLCLAAASASVWVAFASGSPGSHNVTVLAKDNGLTISPNKYMQDNMFFSPGTVTVSSGDSITFKFDKPNSMEPHTLTIVKRSQLPRTGAQVENCRACEMLASGHLKNPKAAPDQNNPIVHWTLNKGQPGLDTVGDSVAIQEPGAHKSVTVKVSAPAGTTLYFLCAVHPWMQGKIVVK